jgi:uncharacterized protein YkwD
MRKLYIPIIISLALVFYIVPVTTSHAAPEIYADAVLAHTNVERYRRGLPFLESDAALSEVAMEKMKDLFARQYFEHESPTGETVSDLAKDAGYRYITVGENLALGDFGSSKGVVEAWMESKGHRENILSESYTEIGIAAGRSNYEGRYTWIIVQAFGLPRSSCPNVDSDLREEIDRLDDRIQLLERLADIREVRLEEHEGSVQERQLLINAYNLVARIYNDTVEEYRDLVEEYNEDVDGFNSCLESKVAKR